jgi:acyl-coenzyme A synthetase/AMP-(fatty) acid ligase
VGLYQINSGRRTLPGGRRLVVDRDGDDHDHAAARGGRHQAGLGDVPVPGVDVDIVDNEGRPVGIPGGGYLVLRRPWPAMLCGIYGDPERYKETYWSRFQGLYFAGV